MRGRGARSAQLRCEGHATGATRHSGCPDGRAGACGVVRRGGWGVRSGHKSARAKHGAHEARLGARWAQDGRA